jgi:hypothetical protein
MKLFTTEIINIGQETVIDSCPDNTENSVVFEDDGATGYFYAIERTANTKLNILDAVHIYNVDNIVDRHIPSEIKIYWTNDLTKSALTINDDFHAIMDFKNKKGLCRTGFPKPSKTWPSSDQRLLTENEINDFNNE